MFCGWRETLTQHCSVACRRPAEAMPGLPHYGPVVWPTQRGTGQQSTLPTTLGFQKVSILWCVGLHLLITVPEFFRCFAPLMCFFNGFVWCYFTLNFGAPPLFTEVFSPFVAAHCTGVPSKVSQRVIFWMNIYQSNNRKKSVGIRVQVWVCTHNSAAHSASPTPDCHRPIEGSIWGAAASCSSSTAASKWGGPSTSTTRSCAA